VSFVFSGVLLSIHPFISLSKMPGLWHVTTMQSLATWATLLGHSETINSAIKRDVPSKFRYITLYGIAVCFIERPEKNYINYHHWLGGVVVR